MGEGSSLWYRAIYKENAKKQSEFLESCYSNLTCF